MGDSYSLTAGYLHSIKGTMAKDRRSLRRFPGRKRIGRQRRNSAQRPSDVAPVPHAARKLALAIASAEFVDPNCLQSAFQSDQEMLLRSFEYDRSHASVPCTLYS